MSEKTSSGSPNPQDQALQEKTLVRNADERRAAEEQAKGESLKKTAEEQKKASEKLLKADAQFADQVEGVGPLLIQHIDKFRSSRASVQNADPETQQRADQTGVRRLIASLILDNACGVMGGLTETEQASLRAVAIKLKA